MKNKLIHLIVFSAFLFLINTPCFASDTYPYGNQGLNPDQLDPWGWYKWNCTSYAGWKVRENYIANFVNYFTRNGVTRTFGNGGNWDNVAPDLGFQVVQTPSVGSVAVWNPWTAYANHEFGHVSWVESIGTDSIYVSYYNSNFDGAYHEETIVLSSNRKPDAYIIFGNISCNPTISNTTVNNGQTYNCSLPNVTILPETTFQQGSNVNITSQ